jgi:hypothetical protein
MRKLLVGIAFAALTLSNLALLHRLGAMRDQVTPVRRPVERTVVVEKPAPTVDLVPSPPPASAPVAESPASPVARAPARLESPSKATLVADDLELSDYQRARLEEHKSVRDLTHAAADEIYDAAMRMELTPEQYEKWKCRPTVTFIITGDAVYRSGALTEFNP